MYFFPTVVKYIQLSHVIGGHENLYRPVVPTETIVPGMMYSCNLKKNVECSLFDMANVLTTINGAYRVMMYLSNIMPKQIVQGPSPAPSSLILGQGVYHHFQRKVELVMSQVNIIKTLVNSEVLLFPKGLEFIWVELPNGLVTPLEIRWWPQIRVPLIDINGEEYEASGLFMGGFPVGTKIYHHDKVFHL